MGPVFPELYDATKKYGSGPVTEYICENNWASMPHIRGDVVEADLTKNENLLVDKVWEEYGHFEGFQLSALTHEDGSPWEEVYVPGVKNIPIPDSLIKQYFVELTE
ncbi:Panacea domain-containing protein [Mesorhizobium sp. M2D.F.Ca.ET.223.01.1.1]|uniref:Panacea domain-containing protein n=1 Tax=Mesorhizobium sp. M2D.F.Ca.ET.223.01.1.1 TaxID=2563940 RepID=UPI00142E9BE2|nr:Panacea domain-containing protein [Mesorhizobium sp. M2D.F.Ca.ET.223.01.1.1]